MLRNLPKVTVEMGKPEIKARALNHRVYRSGKRSLHLLCFGGAAYINHNQKSLMAHGALVADSRPKSLSVLTSE